MDEATLDLLKEAQSRINVMALIHEKLYRSKDLARVQIRDYLKDLTDNLHLMVTKGESLSKFPSLAKRGYGRFSGENPDS